MRGSLSRVALIKFQWLLSKGSIKNFLRKTCVERCCWKHSGASARQKLLYIP